MRIAFLSHTVSSSSGGVERIAWTLTRALLARGHSVHLFARRFDALPEGAVAQPVSGFSLLPGGRHTGYAHAVDRMLRRQHFDVVHSFTRTLQHDILRLGGGTHREYLNRMESERTPLDAWFSRINPKERAILNLERAGFEAGHYKRIVAVSARVRDEVIRHYGVPASDITVLHNGVDTQRFNPALRATVRDDLRRSHGLQSSCVILFCGTGFKRKGLRYALEAVSRVPDAVLLVVGDGDTTPYRRLVRTLHIESRVRFLGPRSEVEHLYAAADLLILPTLYDPFPNVCLEAMACGTPVLTTRTAGVSELIVDGVNSFVVEDATHVDAMAERIRRLSDLPALGPAAAETARSRTFEKYIDETLSLYDGVSPLTAGR